MTTTSYCEAWHTGPGGASVVPSTDAYELKKLLGTDGAQPQPPFPAYIVLVDGKPGDMLAADQVCPACLAALEAQYHRTTPETPAPMSEARRQSPALTTEELAAFRQTADDARYVNTFWSGQYAWTVARLLAEVERLRTAQTQSYYQMLEQRLAAQGAALRKVLEIAQVVADAGVGDDRIGL